MKRCPSFPLPPFPFHETNTTGGGGRKEQHTCKTASGQLFDNLGAQPCFRLHRGVGRNGRRGSGGGQRVQAGGLLAADEEDTGGQTQGERQGVSAEGTAAESCCCHVLRCVDFGGGGEWGRFLATVLLLLLLWPEVVWFGLGSLEWSRLCVPLVNASLRFDRMSDFGPVFFLVVCF